MSEFKFECIHCGQHLQCDEQFSGRQITCPSCKGVVDVPLAGKPVMQKTGMTFVPDNWRKNPAPGGSGNPEAPK
jgi:hypothetical protein